jgi:hypothetical protein
MKPRKGDLLLFWSINILIRHTKVRTQGVIETWWANSRKGLLHHHDMALITASNIKIWSNDKKGFILIGRLDQELPFRNILTQFIFLSQLSQRLFEVEF